MNSESDCDEYLWDKFILFYKLKLAIFFMTCGKGAVCHIVINVDEEA